MSSAHPIYSREQLAEAFALVQPKKDWKNSISAVIDVGLPGHDVSLVLAAVDYFCGGGGVATQEGRSLTKMRIRAPGYYNRIGA